MESVTIKKFTGKTRERREYSGLDVVLKDGRSLFTYYLFVSSFEHCPGEGKEGETLKITCADYRITIKGRNLLPIKNDLKAKNIDILQEGKEYKNRDGKASVVEGIEIS